MNRHTMFRAFCGAALFLAIGSASLAQFLPGGGVDTTDPVLPPPGVYLSPDDVHAMYTGANLAIVLTAVQHQPFKDRLPEHFGTTNENHDFDSTVQGMVQCIGDCGPLPTLPVPFEASGRVQTVAFNKPPGMVIGTFQTEMLAMSLQGSGPTPPFIMIRESPTLASLGQTRIIDTGGGMYHIDSFFDVFTELSLDGGGSWIPSAASTRVNLVPEPAGVVLLGLAFIGCARLFRCRMT